MEKKELSRRLIPESALFFALRNIIREVQYHLHLWHTRGSEAVVNIDIGLKLETVPNDLLAPLCECLFHVIVWSESHLGPKRILDSSLTHTNRMIDAVPAALVIGAVLGSERLGHIFREYIVRIDFRQLQQTSRNRPLARLPCA